MEAVTVLAVRPDVIALEDERLALAARSDPAAFGALYERHVEVVFRFLRARGSDENEAADLTALTFERAFRAIGRYRSGDAGVRPWLLRIARNAAIDEARRRRPERPLHALPAESTDDRLPSPEAVVLEAEERRFVRTLLSTLSEVEREAVALRFASGLSSREIGLVIGKSEAATKKMLSRSMTKLKEAGRGDA